MLVAVVAASVTLVFSLQRVFLYKTNLAETNEQALELALNVEEWAKEQILNYASLADENVTSIQWPIVMPTIRLNDGEISISIHSVQHLYNLNQVRTDMAGFSRLIHYVEPELSSEERTELARNVVLWQSKYWFQFPDENDT